ncbi:MAG: isopenicillin N synthase family dioxygenase [Woeseiaceae bacterium]
MRGTEGRSLENLQEDLDKYPVAESGETANQVPIIDVSAVVTEATSQEAREAVDAIAAACRDWGFFQVINHGVQEDLLDRTWLQTRSFFAQPATAKKALIRTRANPWGYYNNELTKNQRDKKEVFDFTTDGRDPIYGAENRWPDADDGFSQTMREFRDACTELGLALLEAFCVGLELPAGSMRADFATNHTGFIRLNHYPVDDPLGGPEVTQLPEADLGVHHHSDAGALTVLLQDDVGGLQVFKNGYWHNVVPVPGAFVINTGDMMQVWSNDIYQAAVHRVLAMKQKDRYSIPFFFNPSAATIVEPLTSVISPQRPPRYAPIQWSEFRGKRTDGDYADYGAEVQIAQYRL